MAHETNFCGDRLRMSAFLRVMEYGIPPRPRRFRHRVQVVEEPAYESYSVTTDQTFSPMVISSEQSIHNIPHPLTTEASTPNAEVNHVRHSSLSNAPAIDADSIHEIQCLPAPAEPYRGPVKDNHLESARPLQQHSNILTFNRYQQGPETNAHKTPSKPYGSSIIRKRRLPVTGLALLRTTTSDGLPAPSESNDALTTPISEIDPIEDSQMVSGRTVVPTKDKALERRILPKKPRTGSTHVTKLMKSPVRRCKKPLAHHDPELEVQSSFAVASDGFVGEELTINTTKKKRTKRPGTSIVGPKQFVSAVARLALGNGRLPSPELDFTNPSLALSDCGSFNRIHTPLEAENNLYIATPKYLALVSRHNEVSRRSMENNHFQIQENAIHTQLSSITAPARHDSDSSQSVVMKDDGFTNNNQYPTIGVSFEEEDHNAKSFTNNNEGNETDCSGHSQLVSLRRKPTYVNDTSYFSNAMNSLDLSVIDIMTRVRSQFPDAII